MGNQGKCHQFVTGFDQRLRPRYAPCELKKNIILTSNYPEDTYNSVC